MHCETNIICYSTKQTEASIALIKQNGSEYAMSHEIMHIFASDRLWEAEAESFAHLGEAYFIGKSNIVFDKKVNIWPLTTLQGEFDKAQENFKSERLCKFSYENGTALDYYLFGLVGKVGWETYKKVFRSYADGSYTPKNYGKYEITPSHEERYYKAPDKVIRARDFFDRVAHFSGDPNVLRSLPDKGRILDLHFSPRVVQNGQRR